MTICIAANFAEGVVVAADRMISASHLTLEFDHPDTKIHPISSSCVVLSAGDALVIDELLRAGTGIAGQLQNPMVMNFADHLRLSYVNVRQQLASRKILEPRGLSFESFYREGRISMIPAEMAMALDSRIQQLQLGISLIVAGIDSSGAHIFGIDDPGQCVCFDRIGYHSIGSGHRHALLTLIGNKQDRRTTANDALRNVYMAKRAAEVAPGVGKATDMWVITQDGIMHTQEIIPKLERWYDNKYVAQHSRIPSFNLEDEYDASTAQSPAPASSADAAASAQSSFAEPNR